MTTPKRNEAVAWAVVVDGTPDYASVHKYACDSEAGVYGIGPTVSVEPLYSHEQMDALQGEVSRLRAALDDAAVALSAAGYALAEFEGFEKRTEEAMHKAYAASQKAHDANGYTNLEPTTDGR